VAAAPPLRDMLRAELVPGRGLQSDSELLDAIQCGPQQFRSLGRPACDRSELPVNHLAGTCRLGDPSDGRAVVDLRLRVAAFAAMPQTRRCKVVVAGDPAVGKTALVQMFHSAGQRFPKHYLMTLGVEFCMKAVTLSEADTIVEMHLFDTAGQDIYAEMAPSFWEGAEAVVLVYDVTRAHTLEACANWYGRLLQTLGKESMPGIIVANKMDLRERLVVKRPDGQQMAAQLGLEFFETSAQDSQDVDVPFQALAKLIHTGPVMDME